MPGPQDDLTARHLAKVVESSDDAIVSKNLDSIITSWNPAAERMFGYTDAEAVGKSIRMLIPDDPQGEEDVVLAKVRLTREAGRSRRARGPGQHAGAARAAPRLSRILLRSSSVLRGVAA